MCRFCEYTDSKIADLKRRRREMICQDTGKKRLLYPERKAEFQSYYQRNRERKLKAANERNWRNGHKPRIVSGDVLDFLQEGSDETI